MRASISLNIFLRLAPSNIVGFALLTIINELSCQFVIIWHCSALFVFIFHDTSRVDMDVKVALVLGAISITSIDTVTSIHGIAFADPAHCDQPGWPTCYSVGYSDGQTNPWSSCLLGHSKAFCNAYNAAAGSSTNNNYNNNQEILRPIATSLDIHLAIVWVMLRDKSILHTPAVLLVTAQTIVQGGMLQQEIRHIATNQDGLVVTL